MVSELITLPLRLGARAARLWLTTAEEALRLAAGLAEQAIESVRGAEPEQRSTDSPRTPPSHPRSERAPTDAPAAAPAPDTPAAPRAEATPASAEPAVPAEFIESHVSSEPTLVEEFAEPGAEEGAGAELHVAEPWPDYQGMPAKDIIARLEQASQAELAAVDLYERTHRARETVLAAAEYRLAHASGGGAQT